MLSMASFTLLPLSSLPQPVTAMAPIPSAAVTAAAAAIFVNLLDCSAMSPLLLPGSLDISRLRGPY
jgi:hypothetical protein